MLRSRIDSVFSAWQLLSRELITCPERGGAGICLRVSHVGEICNYAALSATDQEAFKNAVFGYPQVSVTDDMAVFKRPIDPRHLLVSMFPKSLSEARSSVCFTTALRRFYSLEGNSETWHIIRELVASINREYKPDQRFSLQTCTEALIGQFEGGRDVGFILECLFDYLLARRSLYPDLQQVGQVFLRGILDSDFILNTMFDLGLSVRGINFILEGGLRISDEYGHSLLVLAKPGQGKTTLSLQIAVDIAAAGGVSFFFSVEHDLPGLYDVLSRYSLYNPSFYEVIEPHKYSLNRVREVVDGGRGALILSEFPIESLGDACKRVAEKTHNLGLAPGARVASIVDSVHALQSPEPDTSQWRHQIYSLIQSSTREGRILVLVDERHQNQDKQVVSYEEYLVDTVFSLEEDTLA